MDQTEVFNKFGQQACAQSENDSGSGVLKNREWDVASRLAARRPSIQPADTGNDKKRKYRVKL